MHLLLAFPSCLSLLHFLLLFIFCLSFLPCFLSFPSYLSILFSFLPFLLIFPFYLSFLPTFPSSLSFVLSFLSFLPPFLLAFPFFLPFLPVFPSYLSFMNLFFSFFLFFLPLLPVYYSCLSFLLSFLLFIHTFPSCHFRDFFPTFPPPVSPCHFLPVIPSYIYFFWLFILPFFFDPPTYVHSNYSHLSFLPPLPSCLVFHYWLSFYCTVHFLTAVFWVLWNLIVCSVLKSTFQCDQEHLILLTTKLDVILRKLRVFFAKFTVIYSETRNYCENRKNCTV